MILSLLEQFEIVSLLPLNIFCFDFSATNLLLINIFTLFGNLIGLISYSFTVTSLIIVTFALSFSIFIGINIIGFQRHKAKILSLVITVNIFLVIYCVPYIDLVVNTMDTKFFSYLHCDSPNWEVENIKPIGQFSSLELGVLFILVLALIIVFLYFIWLIYSSKKRRTLLQVVFDKYIYLFMSALNKTLPRRVIYITGGFGSLLVRVLFYYNLINIKSAIVLAFILPFMSFAFFLAFLLLPLYLSGTYPNSFGKSFFRFLERFASREGFSVLICEHHTDRKYLPVVYKPGKYLPVIQKRGYREQPRN